jgi:hypothetical protein
MDLTSGTFAEEAWSQNCEQIMGRGQQFRDLLRRGGLTIAPGAYK